MRFLIDADVLSEPTKPEPRRSVVEWLRQHEPDLGICSITLGELRLGILKLAAGRRRRSLETWYENGVEVMAIVDFDAAAASQWALLMCDLQRRGRPMPVADSLLAATARSRGLTVVTRNEAHFRDSGVRLLNPYVS